MEPEGVIDSTWDEVCENFDDIYSYGFEKPSATQQRAIVPCIKGFDVIAQAQSGTGKTATFAVSILQKIDTSLRECQVCNKPAYIVQCIIIVPVPIVY